MAKIKARLQKLNIRIPKPVAPVANYQPFQTLRDQVYVSGQISLAPEGLIAGRVGDDLDLDTARKAAQICAINLITQFHVACDGDLDRVLQIIKLGGFVNAAPNFMDVPQVINGASDLLVDVFGDNGRHARSAVGVSVLPLNAAVEIDAIIAIKL